MATVIVWWPAEVKWLPEDVRTPKLQHLPVRFIHCTLQIPGSHFIISVSGVIFMWALCVLVWPQRKTFQTAMEMCWRKHKWCMIYVLGVWPEVLTGVSRNGSQFAKYASGSFTIWATCDNRGISFHFNKEKLSKTLLTGSSKNMNGHLCKT